tara:strand:+ start:984 stop:1181 length:198 start_codon:yes stop_codon:yes gene_type:complete
VVSQKDMFISANTLIKQHGPEKALEYADSRIEELYHSGDQRGAVVWGGIKRAIQELENTDCEQIQ